MLIVTKQNTSIFSVLLVIFEENTNRQGFPLLYGCL